MFELPKNIFDKDNKIDLFPLLMDLTKYHADNCEKYKKIIDIAFPNYKNAKNIDDIPFLPVSIFKQRNLKSIPQEDVSFKIQSSGTTGSVKSQVSLNKENAKLSARSLSYILKEIIGEKRLPMLFIDSASTLKSNGNIGARSAAILGLMPFGIDHSFVLDDNMNFNIERFNAFLSKHKNKDILIYGFTSLIWEKLLPICKKIKPDLSHAVLLHSGGWKHLEKQNIDNKLFKSELKTTSKINEIINFYGMAETPGIIFPENKKSTLSIPNFSYIIIRDPITNKAVENGKSGLVQIFNPFAHSFPGHSILTEDIGVIRENSLKIIGRAKKSEPRGCSDFIKFN